MSVPLVGRTAIACLLLTWCVMRCGPAMAGEQPVPLTELGTGKYHGEAGGLYGDGCNAPPATHAALAVAAVDSIQPLSAAGKPAADGMIVLLSIGMSNTTQEFSAFAQMVSSDRRMRPGLVLVDGAQGGADAAVWAGQRRPDRRDSPNPWPIVDARLQAAGATREQVQAIWIKHALAGPARYGEWPGHVDALAEALESIVGTASKQYPNLRVVFLSSRIYAGYATRPLNPEPYAYESGFAVRKLIARQTDGAVELNCDSRRGDVRAPVLLWGPYVWANGTTARKADGLVWRREDFGADGTHPSEQGRRKVAEQLLHFFTEDPFGARVATRR